MLNIPTSPATCCHPSAPSSREERARPMAVFWLTGPPTKTTATTVDPIVEIAYRVERHPSDAATTDFVATVDATLTDRRGWQQAGFRLVHRDDASAPYLIVLAEAGEAEALCRPYDVYRKYS